jgi:tetratricopeptide (TPR) repeat protein
MPETYLNLGVVYTRWENYKKGIENFEKALRLNRYDLLTWSNLAEGCLKARRYERAQQEYKRILDITTEHIESQTGLGQVYIALGEKGDGEMFDDAIQHLTEGINLAESRQGSKRLKKTDLAAVYYSRGYARVNLYESAKVFKDESLLRKALEDFRNCARLDPSHHKASRALIKIESRLRRFTSQRITEGWGRVVIMVFSAIIFVLAQANFFFGWPSRQIDGRPFAIDGKYYVMMTFGGLVFMIAGLFLPQLLKLKVAGFELEKSTLDQITSAGTLGITK